jgi:hypothetical protein
MTKLSNVGLMHWRRFAVDLLTAGATFAVVLVAIEGASDMLSLLLLPGVLIGLSLMVEPEVTVRSARDTRWSALLRTSDRDRATAL